MTPISVVIPAYNESESIAIVLGDIKKFMQEEKVEHEIIVVDDNSTDGTQAAKKSGALVVSHLLNRGYGASITTGIKKARYNTILIIDADETYPVKEIGKLLPYIGDFDMVVGARCGRHYHGSLMKRFSRMAFYLLINYVTGETVPDANSGLRIFKKDVAMKFEDDFCNGFSFTTTLTLLLFSNRHLVKFVPIDYMPRKGKSKVKHVRDAMRTIQILLHTISYYNPIKAFLPFSVVSAALFFLFTFCYLFKAKTAFYGLSSVISFFSSMFFLGLGIVTYAVVKGSRNRR